jgi:hypothetical protein
MRPPHRPLPDLELVATGFLRTHEAVVDAGAGVSTELPPKLQLPCITVVRIGGMPVESIWLDEGHLQVSVWASTKAEAAQLAAATRAALLDMEGHRDETATVTGVRDLSGLIWVPDDSEDPTIPRYVFGLAVYLHP